MSLLGRLTDRLSVRTGRRTVLSADLRSTNELLLRLAAATERQARALEVIVLRAFYYDLTEEGKPQSTEEQPQTPPTLPGDLEMDEILAVFEDMEATGEEIPLGAYERFGIAPPDRRSESVEEDPPEVDQEEKESAQKPAGDRTPAVSEQLPAPADRDEDDIITAHARRGDSEDGLDRRDDH